LTVDGSDDGTGGRRSRLTRVAILGDTHGHLDRRVEAIARACDRVVHTGDIGGADVLDALAAGGAVLTAVTGNTDDRRHWPTADLDRLCALPASATVELPGGTLAVEHGDRFAARERHARLRAAHSDAGAIACGHSHRRLVDDALRPWIINPGAAGRSRAHGGPGCILLTADGADWSLEQHVFERRPRR